MFSGAPGFSPKYLKYFIRYILLDILDIIRFFVYNRYRKENFIFTIEMCFHVLQNKHTENHEIAVVGQLREKKLSQAPSFSLCCGHKVALI